MKKKSKDQSCPYELNTEESIKKVMKFFAELRVIQARDEVLAKVRLTALVMRRLRERRYQYLQQMLNSRLRRKEES